MRILTSYSAFAAEVKIIYNSFRLRDMGLLCSTSFTGFFVPSEMDDVITFCKHNRGFHIVSSFENGFVWNRYHSGGAFFNLAEGNSDPSLVLDSRDEGEEVLEEIFSTKPWK